MMKTRLLLLAFTTLLCTCVRAQITDDFEDGNLENPTWFGDTEDFVVTDGRLRLMADGAGESRLSIDLPQNSALQDMNLEFLIDMDFSPSASNLTTLLLEDCNGDDCVQKGIIVIGGITGSDDRIEILFADGTPSTELLGSTGAVGSAPAVVRFRLQHVQGELTFSADYTGGNDLVVEDAGTANPLDVNRFTIVCEYTATRADKFSFDDFIYSVEQVEDNEAPELVSLNYGAGATIVLNYNEVMDDGFMENISNYSLSGATEIIDVNVIQSEVTLFLSETFPVNETVILTISAARDPAGNEAPEQQLELFFVPVVSPTANNVILNEFMADPNPVVGLPNQEFVELYNPTDTVVDASQISIASGGTPVQLPANTLIPANGYLVLTADLATEFEALGATVVTLNLPSLTNGGDNITLFANGQALVEINYTDDWYNDPERDGGGYSIEYVGTGADAGCSGSWKASEDPTGGTPGRENSVTGRVVDGRAPMVTGLSVTASTIEIFFDEVLDPDQFSDPSIFVLDNGGSISASDVLDPEAMIVTLSVNLEVGVIYTLTILPDFSDCSGNFPAESLTFQLAIPDEPAAGDVIINEILFNPGSGGSDFVELFNTSEKVFQIEGWVLANTQSTSQTTAERIITATRLFLPGEYLTLTADPDDLMMRYLRVDSTLLVEQTLPSLPDDEGNITVRANGIVLDAFDYSEDLHSQLIGDEDGVSLERIRIDATTQDDNNWFSAAQAEGFATPTRENSQRRDDVVLPGDEVFTLGTTTFSPDGDGFEDFLELNYFTQTTNSLARIRIFDAQGRPIRTLREVELLGSTGTIRWDGSNDEGRRARSGIYVLFVELFGPGMETVEEKLTAVLAGGR